jgi:hypothetical protein
MPRKSVRLFAVTIVVLLVAVVGPAMARACTDSIRASSYEGSICCNQAVDLQFAYINNSSWYGDLAYDANRYEWNNPSPTFHAYVSSGSDSYGTSGNVYRSTELIRGGYSSMDIWSVEQDYSC